MGKLILVIGASGSGKSTSLRNLNSDSTFVITPNSKPLPFRGSKAKYNKENKTLGVVKTLPGLGQALKSINDNAPHIKTVIVEDFNHQLTARVMADASKAGFAKWGQLAQDTYNALLQAEESYRDDLTIVVLAHSDTSMDSNGVSKTTLATVGKMLDNQVKIPSYATYMFHAVIRDGEDGPQHVFQTNSADGREAKSPMGCFDDLYIDNDLASILETIENYENDI
jgi:hypothetical protein